MSTARELIGSLQIALKKTFDDSEISLAQIAYWVSFFINKYNSLKLTGGADSGMYLSVFSNVPVLEATTNANPNLVAGRKYFVLPASILDLPNDGGIVYISYPDFPGACQPSYAGVTFDRITPQTARVKYYSPYETPSPDKPCYLVVGNYVYLLGIDCVSVPELEVGLHTSFNPLTDCSIDSTLSLDPGLYADVYKNVLDLGRWVMLVPVDYTNDASDDTEQEAPTQRVVSLNQDNQVE